MVRVRKSVLGTEMAGVTGEVTSGSEVAVARSENTALVAPEVAAQAVVVVDVSQGHEMSMVMTIVSRFWRNPMPIFFSNTFYPFSFAENNDFEIFKFTLLMGYHYY